MRVALLWQGLSGRYGQWKDGLFAAMKLMEISHDIRYFDFPLVGIEEFNPDVVLYWEAPCTILGKDASNYLDVLSLPYKKCLLFAGGPIKREWLTGFDLVFVESEINEDELTALDIPWKRAFGVNTQIMKPQTVIKTHDAFMQATFADWKRHDLFAQAVGINGCVAGRIQEHDRNGYDECVKRGVTIYDEQTPEKIAELINSSYCVLNTASYWGGGQRCTLEAMACGVPVIVMKDSPKNVEFVEEANCGFVVEPDAQAIKRAVEDAKTHDGMSAHEYVKNYWSEVEYHDALLEGIENL